MDRINKFRIFAGILGSLLLVCSIAINTGMIHYGLSLSGIFCFYYAIKRKAAENLFRNSILHAWLEFGGSIIIAWLIAFCLEGDFLSAYKIGALIVLLIVGMLISVYQNQKNLKQ
jgi:hypothetical protein